MVRYCTVWYGMVENGMADAGTDSYKKLQLLP